MTEAVDCKPLPGTMNQVLQNPAARDASRMRDVALLTSAAAALWTAAMGSYAVWRHDQFLSHRYDLGNMVQAVWSSAHGRLLEVTDDASGGQVVRLVGHVDPILALFVPFWWLYPAPETLIMLQAAALATGLYPVVRLALKHVCNPVSVVLLSAWYLAFPWLLWSAVNDLHPVTFAIPCLLWAIWFLDEQRLVPFSVVAALALATGELIGLTIAAIGVWYAVSHRRIRAGISIAVVGATWVALCLFVFIPAMTDGESSRFYARFETVGGSPSGAVRTLITHPTTILSAVSTEADLRYVAYLLLPTALLFLGAPLLAAAALPQLSVNLLSDFWSTTQPTFQYVAAMVPVLVGATIIGLGRLPKRLRGPASIAPLAAAVVGVLVVPPLPGAQDFVFSRRDSAERVETMRVAIAQVPPDAAVTTTNRLGAHLSTRRHIFLFPERSGAEWAVLDTSDAWLQIGGEKVDKYRFGALLKEFEGESSWKKIFDRDGIRVYRKRSVAPNLGAEKRIPSS